MEGLYARQRTRTVGLEGLSKCYYDLPKCYYDLPKWYWFGRRLREKVRDQ